MPAARRLEQLPELGADLNSRGIRAELFVVGGAAMSLAYNTRRTTRDVDAVFEPTSEIRAAARRVADTHALPEDWLNDDALEAMGRMCDDCAALPYEPCHRDCSSRWD